ncbi:MAG: hypothetical protein IJ068_06430 [Bacilli bacterium]|nr:hypothetical protein [Bacilli bacterium]
MIENLIKGYNGEENNVLNTYIEGLDLNGLVNFYLKCSNHLLFQKYSNSMNDILTSIYNKIMKKLPETSLLEVMDVYFNIFTESLYVEDSIEANQNIINVRNYNLNDDFFIEYESKRRKMSKDEFIENYSKSMEYYEEDKLYLKSVFDYLDKLQLNVLEYLNKMLHNLTDTERHLYLIKINEIIEDNSLEIIKRNEIRKNKRIIDIQSKMRDISTIEVFNMLDTTSLKNKIYIYSSFQAVLKDKENKKI